MRPLLSRALLAALATAATAAHAQPHRAHDRAARHHDRAAEREADRSPERDADDTDAAPQPESDDGPNRVVVVNVMPKLGALDQVARLRKVLDARGMLLKLSPPIEATLDGSNSLIADIDQIRERYANTDYKGASALIDADQTRLMHGAIGADLPHALATLAQWRAIIADARGHRDEAIRQFRAAYRLDPASKLPASIIGPEQRDMIVAARQEVSETGVLHIEADPDDARVAIDGGEARHRRGDIELPLGIHLVVISAAGRKPYAELVDIRADDPYPLSIRLENETELVRAARLVDETAAAPAGKSRLATAGHLARFIHDDRILVIEDANEHHITLRLYDVSLHKVSRPIELGDDAPSALIERKIRGALDPDNLVDADAIILRTGPTKMHWYQHWYVWAGAAALLGGGIATYELANRSPTRIEGF